MATTLKRNWLIGYDICDSKRLGRIHRELKKVAIPVQYSLFLYNGSTKDAHKLIDQLAQHMNLKQDDLRAYPIPTRAEITVIGQSRLPQDIILTDTNFGETLKTIQHQP